MPYSFNPFTGTLDYYQAGSGGASLYSAGNSGTAKTINWSNGNAQVLTLTGNCTISFSNPPAAGTVLVLQLLQDSTGGRTVVWPAPVVWPSQTTPTLTTTSSRTDNITLFYDGTSYYASYTLAYKPYNPNFDPTQITGNILWLDGADASSMVASGGGTPTNGNSVAQWNDKSGSSHHATASGADQPVFNTGQLNSKSALNFNGANFMPLSSSVNGTFLNTGRGFTYVFVMKQATYPGTAYYARLFNPPDQNGHYLNVCVLDSVAGSTDSFQFNDDSSGAWTLQQKQNAGLTSWNKLSIQYSGSGATTAGNFILAKNGSVQTTTAGVNSGSGLPVAVGGIQTGAAPVNFIGTLAEVIVYDNKISVSDLSTLNTYLFSKWGL